MNLSIDDDTFEIDRAMLLGFVIDPQSPQQTASGVYRSGLFWSLDIESFEESIRFYFEAVQIPGLKTWLHLVGNSVSWNEPTDVITEEKNGGWYGGYYLGGHHDITRAELVLTERDGRNFVLDWKGTCSKAPLGLTPQPDELVPFAINCWITFVGVSAPYNNREIIGKFLNLDDLRGEFTSPPLSSINTPVLEPNT